MIMLDIPGLGFVIIRNCVVNKKDVLINKSHDFVIVTSLFCNKKVNRDEMNKKITINPHAANCINICRAIKASALTPCVIINTITELCTTTQFSFTIINESKGNLHEMLLHLL